MNILIVENSIIPAKLYGGTQRVIWSLGKELSKMSHQVTYLVRSGSKCDFANIIFIDDKNEIHKQIPDNIDVVHFNYYPTDLHKVDKPYIVTMHGNLNENITSLDYNTVFVSKNHAERYNSNSFVYNGLDWNDYSKPSFKKNKNYYHFLGKASWGVKNLKGAIKIIKELDNKKLYVLGGERFSERVLKMGPTYFLSTKVNFRGMVGSSEKENYLNTSSGLIFPVLWHEPFGLAIIESLYYGCPVFGTPYGSLPELVNSDVGFLSQKRKEIVENIKNIDLYNNKFCHEYAVDIFNSRKMAEKYLEKYTIVLNGQKLNSNKPQLINIQNQKYLGLADFLKIN